MTFKGFERIYVMCIVYVYAKACRDSQHEKPLKKSNEKKRRITHAYTRNAQTDSNDQKEIYQQQFEAKKNMQKQLPNYET